MGKKPMVTLGVPVYRGEAFLAETLTSIQFQSHREFEVVISLDGPDPVSEDICEPFLADPRFRLVVQPQRLGWVDNINWLMDQVESGFWCYQQQDDLIDPWYLEVLVDHARQAPEAAVVYCDMVAFGQQTWTCSQPSVTGTPVGRQLALLFDHHPAVAFRGLTRVEALRATSGVPSNEVENFSCDTSWMANVARWGDLRRVPARMYRKRYHDDNTHVKWVRWPLEKRLCAWRVHCADMLEQALLVEATLQERRMLWLAAVSRLFSSRIGAGYLPDSPWPWDQREAHLTAFLDYLRTRRMPNLDERLESTWLELLEWTRGFSAAA